jgi:hypothetical protein
MAGGRFVIYEPVTLAAPCTDVRRLDVRNMSFHVREPSFPAGLDFRFRNGKTTRGDNRIRGESIPDWRTNIDLGRMATLSDGTVLRLVSIEDSHVTSTTRYYVFALSCHDGALREVFQAGGEGLFLDHRRVSGDTIRLRWAVWRRGDSHAQPSRERIQDFAWVPSFGQFAIVRNEERAFEGSGTP